MRNLLVAWSCVNCMTTLSASGQTSIYLLFICCVQKFIKSFTKKNHENFLNQVSINLHFHAQLQGSRKFNWQFRYANFPLNFVTNASIKMPSFERSTLFNCWRVKINFSTLLSLSVHEWVRFLLQLYIEMFRSALKISFYFKFQIFEALQFILSSKIIAIDFS